MGQFWVDILDKGLLYSRCSEKAHQAIIFFVCYVALLNCTVKVLVDRGL